MQNKGYGHPYGSTLFPGAPPVVSSNGIAQGQDPPGAPSVIPGTIGVAGPRMRETRLNDLRSPEERALPDGRVIARGATGEFSQTSQLINQLSAMQPSSKPTTAGDAMLNGMLDGLINLLADKLAKPIADRVVATMLQKLEEIGTQATQAMQAAQPLTSDAEALAEIAALEAAQAERAARRAEYDRVHAELASPLSRGVVFTGPPNPPMVAGGASGVHAMVTKQVADTAGSALGIDGEQVEAYTAAHRMLVMHVADSLHKAGGHPARVLRPNPPAFELKAQNGAVSEWTAYSAKYDSPRFPLNAGNVPDDYYLVQVDGTRLGWMSIYDVVEYMMRWLRNPPEVQELSSVDASSAGINTID